MFSEMVILTLLQTLRNIGCIENVDRRTRASSIVLLENRWKCENIVTGIFFKEVYAISPLVSTYLQSQDLDYMTAWEQIQILKDELESRKGDHQFQELINKSNTFIQLC